MKAMFLVAAQGIAGVVLACVPFFPRLFEEGRLNLVGRRIVMSSVVLLLGSLVWSQLLNDSEKSRSDQRLNAVFHEVSRCVMMLTGSPAEEAPVPSVAGVIQIHEPPEGSRVGPRHLVRGLAPVDAGEIWVIVHPLDTVSYWVQPRISQQASGHWSVLAYFGRSGAVDSGKEFEIVALAEPEEELAEGRVFDRWPKARKFSEARLVVRQ